MSKSLQEAYEGNVSGHIFVLSVIIVLQFAFISFQSIHVASTPRCDLPATEKQVHGVKA